MILRNWWNISCPYCAENSLPDFLASPVDTVPESGSLMAFYNIASPAIPPCLEKLPGGRPTWRRKAVLKVLAEL